MNILIDFKQVHKMSLFFDSVFSNPQGKNNGGIIVVWGSNTLFPFVSCI